MAIADDISVAVNGDIRWTGAATTYTVLAFHRFLQDLADDAVASGDDLIDITSDTPSDRSTDNIISLLGSYNIDDEVAEHLFDGSISQNSGNTVYSGLTVVGSVESGTELMIIRDNKILNNFWGTGLNPDAANNVIMQVMIKTRDGGADIDGQRLRVQARELGDSYAEFSLTAGLGNSTAAVFTSSDLNNATLDATISGWTTITNTEGFQLLDIGDGDGVLEEYYSQWNIGSQTVNDVYERTKWIQARQTVAADSSSDTGTDYIVDDATTLGRGQSFTVPSHGLNKYLVRCEFDLKIGLGTPTGNMTAEIYAHSGSYGTTSVPTGGALATSKGVPCSKLTGSYQTFNFEFQTPELLTAGSNYVIVIRHADGDASNYVQVDGAASGAHSGNLSTDTGSWAATGAADLKITVYASPAIHTMAGELFRGITHEIVYDTESGNFTEDEVIFWGTNITYDGLANGPFTVGNYVQFQPQGGGTVKNGGKILKDTGSVLTVALEDISGNLLDNDIITEIEDGTATTADINGTPATGGASGQDRAGGEGALLALDDNGTDGDFYIQLLSGSAPVDNLQIEGRSSGQTALVNATITSRTVSPEFIGASTGSNIIGAYGIGFNPNDVGSSDQFFDLTNTLRQPPNNVTFSVTGLVPGEDRVLVGPRTAGVLDKDQFQILNTLTGLDETGITISGAVPSDTPNPGTVRVELNNGVYNRIVYTGTTASGFLFSGTSADFSGVSGCTSGSGLFISYIDDIAPATSGLSYTAVYSADRALFVRVRDGGGTPIKTFESPATFVSANASIAAIRTSDA